MAETKAHTHTHSLAHINDINNNKKIEMNEKDTSKRIK